MPNACKSNERIEELALQEVSGGRVSNTWVTCPSAGDNIRKRVLIPHSFFFRLEEEGKMAFVLSLRDGPAAY